MVRLVFGANTTKACNANLLAFLSIFFTGCANSCVSGFWNPPNGTVGVTVGNPPPTCKLATPKGAIRIAVQVSDSCESCSGANRVHAVVLNLSGIDFRASADAAGESSSWQPLLPEPGRQFEFLREKINVISSESMESTEELPIPAGSYDLVRLRLSRDQTRVDDRPLSGNACGETGPNCVIMADGQIAPLLFEPDALAFHLTSEATGKLPLVMPNSDYELLIELRTVLSMTRLFGEATRSFVILPGRAQMAPRPPEKAPTIPQPI